MIIFDDLRGHLSQEWFNLKTLQDKGLDRLSLTLPPGQVCTWTAFGEYGASQLLRCPLRCCPQQHRGCQSLETWQKRCKLHGCCCTELCLACQQGKLQGHASFSHIARLGVLFRVCSRSYETLQMLICWLTKWSEFFLEMKDWHYQTAFGKVGFRGMLVCLLSKCKQSLFGISAQKIRKVSMNTHRTRILRQQHSGSRHTWATFKRFQCW